MYSIWSQKVNQWVTTDSINDNSGKQHFDLTQLGLIEITGADSVKFLQGQLTSNLTELTHENAQFSAFCNHQGRILSLFTLFLGHDKNQLFAVMPKEIIASSLEALKKYAVFFQVTLSDVTENWMIWGEKAPENHFSWQQPITPFFPQVQKSDSGFSITTPVGRVFIEPIDQMSRLCDEKSFTENWSSYSQWLIAEIRLGLPRLYSSTVAEFLPHHLQINRWNAISFTKGCYTGQEIVARMEYKGKIKSQLYIFRTETAKDAEILPGHSVFLDDKKVGDIVASAYYNDESFTLAICQNKIDEFENNHIKIENHSILDGYPAIPIKE